MSAESVPGEPSRARRVAHALASGSLVTWLAALALAWSSSWSYFGELAASTRPWLELTVVLPALLCSLVRWRALALVACGIGLLSAQAELFVNFAPHDASAGTPELCLVTANLLAGNPDLDAAFATLRAQDADVIALQELTRDVLPALRALAHEYPFQLVFPAADARWDANTWGLALLSRRAFTSARAIQLEEGALPLLEIEIDGHPIPIRMTHAPDPSSSGRWRARQRHLELVAGRAWPSVAILCGDLNVTPGSADFRALQSRTGLRDTRISFGSQPTWGRGQLPFGLGIAIDHVLAGRAWRVADRGTFDVPGSDHRGIRVVLAR